MNDVKSSEKLPENFLSCGSKTNFRRFSVIFGQTNGSNMIDLNLPEFPFKIVSQNGKKLIFDSIRKKNVALTPEEWVRQHFVNYLIRSKGYPAGLIGVEVSLTALSQTRRSDIVVYDKCGQPVVIIECKAPSVKISQNVFEQITFYNIALHVNYLIVTNGVEHFCCKMDYTNASFHFIPEIPSYDKL